MQRIEFPSGDLTLEGVLSVPGGEGLFPLVVVYHPHPLYGGSMHNNVVDAVCASLEEQRIGWLKFNFRGVGRSGGSYSDGIGEKEDARAAISFGEHQPGVNRERIGLCGYSFGSIVGFPVAVEGARVRAVAGIAPFVRPEGLFAGFTRPKLFVCGTRDEYVPSDQLERVVSTMPEPKELALFPGVDHFWSGHERPMAERVAQFFARCLKG